MTLIRTAYDVYKELEKEPQAPEYGESFGQLDKDSWGSDIVDQRRKDD